MLAKAEQALSFATGQLETVGDSIGAGAVLLLEYFGRGIRSNDTAPLVSGEEFRVLRNRDQRQIALACTTGEIGQETTTFRVFDQRPGLIDVKFTGPGRMQHLRPHEIGDQKDTNGTQFTRHITDIEDDEVIVKRDVSGRIERP